MFFDSEIPSMFYWVSHWYCRFAVTLCWVVNKGVFACVLSFDSESLPVHTGLTGRPLRQRGVR